MISCLGFGCSLDLGNKGFCLISAGLNTISDFIKGFFLPANGFTTLCGSALIYLFFGSSFTSNFFYCMISSFTSNFFCCMISVVYYFLSLMLYTLAYTGYNFGTFI